MNVETAARLGHPRSPDHFQDHDSPQTQDIHYLRLQAVVRIAECIQDKELYVLCHAAQ